MKMTKSAQYGSMTMIKVDDEDEMNGVKTKMKHHVGRTGSDVVFRAKSIALCLLALGCVIGGYFLTTKVESSLPVLSLQLAKVEMVGIESLGAGRKSGRKSRRRYKKGDSYKKLKRKKGEKLTEDDIEEAAEDSEDFAEYAGGLATIAEAAFGGSGALDIAGAAIGLLSISNPILGIGLSFGMSFLAPDPTLDPLIQEQFDKLTGQLTEEFVQMNAKLDEEFRNINVKLDKIESKVDLITEKVDEIAETLTEMSNMLQDIADALKEGLDEIIIHNCKSHLSSFSQLPLSNVATIFFHLNQASGAKLFREKTCDASNPSSPTNIIRSLIIYPCYDTYMKASYGSNVFYNDFAAGIIGMAARSLEYLSGCPEGTSGYDQYAYHANLVDDLVITMKEQSKTVEEEWVDEVCDGNGKEFLANGGSSVWNVAVLKKSSPSCDIIECITDCDKPSAKTNLGFYVCPNGEHKIMYSRKEWVAWGGTHYEKCRIYSTCDNLTENVLTGSYDFTQFYESRAIRYNHEDKLEFIHNIEILNIAKYDKHEKIGCLPTSEMPNTTWESSEGLSSRLNNNELEQACASHCIKDNGFRYFQLRMDGRSSKYCKCSSNPSLWSSLPFADETPDEKPFDVSTCVYYAKDLQFESVPAHRS